MTFKGTKKQMHAKNTRLFIYDMLKKSANTFQEDSVYNSLLAWTLFKLGKCEEQRRDGWKTQICLVVWHGTFTQTKCSITNSVGLPGTSEINRRLKWTREDKHDRKERFHLQSLPPEIGM